MTRGQAWQCPYCQHFATATDEVFSEIEAGISETWAEGDKSKFYWRRWVCPNPSCRQMTITADLYQGKHATNQRGQLYWVPGTTLGSWRLRPASVAKPQPSYIPVGIVADYAEACAVGELSPKASATLSRRCLQGMIRDRWKIVKNRLIDEIDALKDNPQVDPLTWKAIDAVRKTGNIGAHMEKDVNLIIEVSPTEAQQMISLLEYLFKDWYVDRHTREQQMKALVAMSDIKQESKKTQ